MAGTTTRATGSIISIVGNFPLTRLINSQHARKNEIRERITRSLVRVINITSSLNVILNGPRYYSNRCNYGFITVWCGTRTFRNRWTVFRNLPIKLFDPWNSSSSFPPVKSTLNLDLIYSRYSTIYYSSLENPTFWTHFDTQFLPGLLIESTTRFRKLSSFRFEMWRFITPEWIRMIEKLIRKRNLRLIYRGW